MNKYVKVTTSLPFYVFLYILFNWNVTNQNRIFSFLIIIIFCTHSRVMRECLSSPWTYDHLLKNFIFTYDQFSCCLFIHFIICNVYFNFNSILYDRNFTKGRKLFKHRKIKCFFFGCIIKKVKYFVFLTQKIQFLYNKCIFLLFIIWQLYFY